MKYTQTFAEAYRQVRLRKTWSEAVKEEDEEDSDKEDSKLSSIGKIKLAKEKDTDAKEKIIVGLTNQISMLKQQLDNEKNKLTKPEPNPETGEVPLRTGVAAAILDKKGPSPEIEKTGRSEVKLSKKKSKIEINPDVEIGQISGGNKASTGNLH